MATVSDVRGCGHCEGAQAQAFEGDRQLEAKRQELKVYEIFHKILSPHIENLSREDVLKIQLAAPLSHTGHFTCALELLKIKIDDYTKAGFSIEEFSAEMKKLDSSPESERTSYLLKEKEEKQQLMVLRFGVGVDAKDCSADTFSASYPSPYLQLAALEKATHFPVGGSENLVKEMAQDVKIFKKAAISDYSLRQKNKEAAQVYQQLVFPNFKKIVETLENEKDIERIQKVVAIYVTCLTPELSDAIGPALDPFVHALPYIAKYGSLANIEPYFNERFKKETPWDKAYLWVDLHCQVAELLATTDTAKAQEYLAKAEKQKPVHTLSYFNYYAQSQKIKEAEARIVAAQAKVG
jgi:hypothetical protein